jgi:hypothetical protein
MRILIKYITSTSEKPSFTINQVYRSLVANEDFMYNLFYIPKNKPRECYFTDRNNIFGMIINDRYMALATPWYYFFSSEYSLKMDMHTIASNTQSCEKYSIFNLKITVAFFEEPDRVVRKCVIDTRDDTYI